MRPRPLRSPRRGLLLVLAASTLSCASPGSDIHLAPLYTRMHTGDGGRRTEIAGGLYRENRSDDDDFLEWRTASFLWGIDRRRDGSYTSHHPYLLGNTVHLEDDKTVSYVLPLYLYTRKKEEDGSSTRRLAMLPGFLFKHEREGGLAFGWFPFFGGFQNFLTFDEIRFVLWPLFVYARRDDRVSYHLPWPLIGWTKGNGESSHHVLPLYAKSEIEGRYKRWSFLWPFFHFQRNFLGGGGEEPETAWMFFPVAGRTDRGSYSSTTAIWPLFGYAHDPRSNFWALDAPFPIVRLQRGPNDEVSRTRFWPLFSHLRADGLTAWNFLWPLVHLRYEDSIATRRDSVYVIPFWQSWRKTDKTSGVKSEFQKLWPLYKYEKEGSWHRGQFPALNPLRKSELPGRFLSSVLHLWEWEDEGELRRERSFLGLYRRERGRGEDRRSVSMLWSSRSFQREDGAAVRETSLLFGLLRWRSVAGEGSGMLKPAFPGPGWPIQREGLGRNRSRTYF